MAAIFLTHAHPDHIGTAYYVREKYGTKVFASRGERVWIENIDLQFAERPIPNFYGLAGKSTPVDHVVKDGLFYQNQIGSSRFEFFEEEEV